IEKRSCRKPGTVISSVRIQPPATALRSSTQTRLDLRTSIAAATSELMPLPMITTSKLFMVLLRRTAFPRRGSWNAMSSAHVVARGAVAGAGRRRQVPHARTPDRSVAVERRAGRATAEERFARRGIVPLLRDGVLRGGVKVAQPSLQWRALVQRVAAAEREACIRDANAGGGDPGRGLRTLRDERFVAQRARECVAPVARGLDLKERPRRAKIGFDTAELGLEHFRIPHRHCGPQLLPAGVG